MSKEPKSRKIPIFASDEEERLFWDTHDPSLYFTRRVGVIEVLDSPPRKKRVSIQMDERVYERLKEKAEEQGVRYQQLVRDILADALSRPSKAEDRARKPGARKATSAVR